MAVTIAITIAITIEIIITIITIKNRIREVGTMVIGALRTIPK